MRDLVSGPRRFVELQRTLPGISTEQLRSRLNRMVADGLLTRERYREVPPRVDYELTDRAAALMPVLGELARWGLEWSWGAPRPTESVDVGAVLRLAPGLLHLDPDLDGLVELVVTGPDGSRHYGLTLDRGRVHICEESLPASPRARAAGDEEAWVAALGPDRDLDGLRRTGDPALLDALLAGYGVAAARVAA